MCHFQRFLIVLTISVLTLGLSATLVYAQTQRISEDPHLSISEVVTANQLNTESARSSQGIVGVFNGSMIKMKNHIMQSLLSGLLELKRGLNMLLDYIIFLVIQNFNKS